MEGDTLIDGTASEVTKVVDRDPKREVRRCSECGQQFSADALFCPFDGTPLTVARWDPSADPLLGKTVDGRYEVVSVLGEGGMGTVYEVRHKALGRSFAMKVLRRDIARQAELGERFTIEAKATAAVKHPNIVSINDFGRLDDATPYFVMEMLVGETLSDLVKRIGPLPPVRAARIVTQIAAGLRAAHEAGIVHRDLKPENVFLVGAPQARGDAKDDVRIVDFGAAKIAGAGRLTKMGVVFGTPHYMAPEQAAGQPVDQRADIYALGVIMYVLFTARVPFEADSYMGVLTQHMYVKPTPPSQVLPSDEPGLGALETVALRALEKKPDDRYQTMTELSAAIDRAVTVTPDGSVVIAPGTPTASRPAPKLLDDAPQAGVGSDDASRLAEMGIGSPSRLPVLLGVMLAVGVIVGLMGWARLSATRAAPAAASGAAASSSVVPATAAPAVPSVEESPPPSASNEAPEVVRLTSTPSFAEVWSEGARVGTTPFDVAAPTPEEPGSAPSPRYVLRLSGYEEHAVALGTNHGPEVHVDLTAKPSTPPSRLAPASSHPKRALGEIDDPWAKQ